MKMISIDARYSNAVVFLDYPKANIHSPDEISRMSECLEDSKIYLLVRKPESDVWITNFSEPVKCRHLLNKYKFPYERIYYVGSIYPVITAIGLHSKYSPSRDFVLFRDSLLFTDGETITLNGVGIVSNSYVIGCDSRDKESLFFLWKLSKLFNSYIEISSGVLNGCSVLSLLGAFNALDHKILTEVYGGGY